MPHLGGPGRRAEGLRIDLPNPPPLPPHGERPDPEEIASHGVIIPHLAPVPGVRPSRQPARAAADLAISKALRMCTNCHKPVDDPHFSKCSGCRRANNERAKRYQAKQKASKAATSGVKLQTIAEEKHDGIQPKMRSEGPQPSTSSKAYGESTTGKTRTRSSTLPAATTATLQPTHDKTGAGTRDRMYMTLIDSLQLDQRHSGGQRMLGPSRKHDINLEALDKMTEIRLSTTARSTRPPQSPLLSPQGGLTGTDSQNAEQQQPRQEEHGRHTLPREQLHYSADYFTLDHHHPPQAPRNSSGSIPIPARSSPPLGYLQSSPGSSMFTQAVEVQQSYQLHPLLANVPPAQWLSLSSSASAAVLQQPLPESPSQLLLLPATSLSSTLGDYPAPSLSNNNNNNSSSSSSSSWDATGPQSRHHYHYQQYNYHHDRHQQQATGVNYGTWLNEDDNNNNEYLNSFDGVTEPMIMEAYLDPELGLFSQLNLGGGEVTMGESSGGLVGVDFSEFIDLHENEEGKGGCGSGENGVVEK
ncbi:hypothetical protein B0T21DRAFT_438589 [Apiosordaria backusii]|uniref:Uncharacterized protein n=1 Tax=Apiosordaria backusii TaxID=314023 RepID=A0AA40BN12_9PEZI|nr:hypothetical protein B0T21DRAFT_438589 [Apiosordaria backusii]